MIKNAARRSARFPRMTLTRRQIAKLERAITARRKALLAEIGTDVARARDESFGAIAGPVVDSADEAFAHLLSDLDHAEISRDLNEARELEAAQARLEDGTFGRCADCGLEIGFARLRANPAALRCVECQRMHEKTFAHPGEPKL